MAILVADVCSAPRESFGEQLRTAHSSLEFLAAWEDFLARYGVVRGDA